MGGRASRCIHRSARRGADSSPRLRRLALAQSQPVGRIPWLLACMVLPPQQGQRRAPRRPERCSLGQGPAVEALCCGPQGGRTRPPGTLDSSGKPPQLLLSVSCEARKLQRLRLHQDALPRVVLPHARLPRVVRTRGGLPRLQPRTLLPSQRCTCGVLSGAVRTTCWQRPATSPPTPCATSSWRRPSRCSQRQCRCWRGWLGPLLRCSGTRGGLDKDLGWSPCAGRLPPRGGSCSHASWTECCLEGERTRRSRA